jgi:hypothetical protein
MAWEIEIHTRIAINQRNAWHIPAHAGNRFPFLSVSPHPSAGRLESIIKMGF